MQDIHDIRPPVMIGIDPLTMKLAIIIIGVVILIVLLFFLVKKFLKRKKDQNNNTLFLPAPLPAFDAAMREFEQLEVLKMSDPRLFYFHLTLVLRRYIGKVYKINAVEMTTQEFAKNINNLGIGHNLLEILDGFLESSDHIKYAGTNPLDDMIKKDLARVKEFIVKVENENQDKNTLAKEAV